MRFARNDDRARCPARKETACSGEHTMIISIASGKGGTGKTTVAVSLALTLENVQFLDCDVEAPNAHVFLKPAIEKTETVTVPVPEIDRRKCDCCGVCADVCVYRAINVFKPVSGACDVLLLPVLCHGCGACALFCPQGAITEKQKGIGVIESGHGGAIEYVCGKLDIGEPKAPPLIKQLKKKINRAKTVILDCPPGTSCPMMTAVKGSDFCLLVTEPTPFGLHDLELAVETVRKLGLPFGVLVNRATDSNLVERYCEQANAPLLGKIPFDGEVAKLYSAGEVPLHKTGQHKAIYERLFQRISELARKEPENEQL